MNLIFLTTDNRQQTARRRKEMFARARTDNRLFGDARRCLPDNNKKYVILQSQCKITYFFQHYTFIIVH